MPYPIIRTGDLLVVIDQKDFPSWGRNSPWGIVRFVGVGGEDNYYWIIETEDGHPIEGLWVPSRFIKFESEDGD